ncbi:MAG: hypothetical protein ACHP7N_01265 [Caulobacterales bacterium]
MKPLMLALSAIAVALAALPAAGAPRHRHRHPAQPIATPGLTGISGSLNGPTNSKGLQRAAPGSLSGAQSAASGGQGLSQSAAGGGASQSAAPGSVRGRRGKLLATGGNHYGGSLNFGTGGKGHKSGHAGGHPKGVKINGSVNPHLGAVGY